MGFDYETVLGPFRRDDLERYPLSQIDRILALGWTYKGRSVGISSSWRHWTEEVFDYSAGHDLNFYWPRFSVRYRPFDWTRDG